MKKFLKNQKGVTMIEVLVTIALLAVVVTPCLSAFVMAQRGNVKAAETQSAYTAAANLMEELKGLSDRDSIGGRLNMNYENWKGEKINNIDGVFVVYEDNGSYWTIWIYSGEGDNRSKTASESVPDGYILKGVIVL